MRTILIILAVICALVATVLGFGFLDDADWQEDVLGWLALSLTFFFAAHLPLDDWRNRP